MVRGDLQISWRKRGSTLEVATEIFSSVIYDENIVKAGINTTPVIDRLYFHSVNLLAFFELEC